ncbi:MAG: hypothetical protein VYC34_11885, partial [Planctomycetota bacterium]|nr:hypothetical protein [Planctomycetota bacterium]
MPNHRRIVGAVAAAAASAISADAAQRLVETVPGPDFNVGTTAVVQMIEFSSTEPIGGIGFTALWTAVVADNEDGLAPWSLDLGIVAQSPDAQSINWEPIGGDVTIADFPLQDFSPGYTNANGDGTHT